MTHSPVDQAVSNKILQLISSCEKLSREFHLYRSALHPSNCFGDSAAFCYGQNSRRKSGITFQQIWEGTSSRNEAVRDFKIFAVNCIHKLLGKNGGFGVRMPYSFNEVAQLQHTADVWLKSVTAYVWKCMWFRFLGDKKIGLDRKEVRFGSLVERWVLCTDHLHLGTWEFLNHQTSIISAFCPPHDISSEV